MLTLFAKENFGFLSGNLLPILKMNCLCAAKMQLAFYLWKLKKHGINVEGEILIPKEKKRIAFNLDENTENLLQAAIENMEEIAQKTSPPPVIKSPFCRKCAFIEFCYA